jgi:signal transduction histidine kinase
MSGIGILDDLCVDVLMVDHDGRIVHATPSAESMLRSSTTFSSTTLQALLSRPNPDWLARDLMESAIGGSWTGTALLTVPDGRNRWVNIQACRAPERAFQDCAMLVFLTDITEHVEMANVLLERSEELFHRNTELEVINRISRLMLGNTDLNSRLSTTLRESADAIGVDFGAIFLKADGSNDLACRCVHGVSFSAETIRIPLNENLLVSRTFHSMEAQYTADASFEPPPIGPLCAELGVRSILGVPLVMSGNAFGAMLLADREPNEAFSKEDVMLVETVANHAASAIYNAMLGDDIRRASRWATLGELLAGAAHNFGNVLMAIQGTLDSVVNSPNGTHIPEEVEEKLRATLKHVARGSDLLHRLLSFSRGSEPTPTRVSLSEVVESAIMLCKSHPATKGKTINNLVDLEFPRVRAHPDSLQEVILNLVLNALQAIEPGGEVRIEAEVMQDETCAVLRIVDNGCGISPEVQIRLFEPFFSTKGGTGLGLPTSMALVNRMGGRMSVESRPGLGTTFSVTLGLAENAAQRNDMAA